MTYCLFLIDLVDDSCLVGPIVDWNRSFLYTDIRVYWFRILGMELNPLETLFETHYLLYTTG